MLSDLHFFSACITWVYKDMQKQFRSAVLKAGAIAEFTLVEISKKYNNGFFVSPPGIQCQQISVGVRLLGQYMRILVKYTFSHFLSYDRRKRASIVIK